MKQIKSINGTVLFEYEGELCNANLRYANLRGADLYGAYLYSANLIGANLERANLYGANLERANLEGANLRGAYLRGANLEGAYLEGADLEGANLRSANLEDAYLRGAKIDPEVYIRTTHLSQDTITGWKKVKGRIVKLEIPSEAGRVHAIGSRKCRAEFAKVLSISDGSTEIHCDTEAGATYKVGEMVHPDKYDDSYLIECSHGIHFFITELEAKEYGL